MKNKKIIIVGAGIVGAALAAELAKKGVDMMLLHEQPLQSGKTATAQSWGWINIGQGENYAYFRLRFESMGLWRSMARKMTNMHIIPAPSCAWDMKREKADAFIQHHNDWGYPVSLLNHRRIAEKIPILKTPPQYGVFSEKDMCVDPLSAVTCLIQCAGVVPIQTHIHALEVSNGKVIGVMSDEGLIQADEVVVAAGYGISKILKTIDINLSLKQPAGLVIYSRPMKQFLSHILISPTVLIRQDHIGRLILVSACEGKEAQRRQHVYDILRYVQDLISCPEEIQIERYIMAERAIPKDGLPLIGRYAHIEGLYIICTHSGITNAPALAKYAVREMIYGKRSSIIEPFGVERTL